MKKSLLTHILVMVIAAGAASFIASALLMDQNKLCSTKTKTGNTACGFNKFIADVQWMLFINYCGSIGSIKAENVNEVYNKLASIIKNDPDFEKAYEIGVLMISSQAPEKAVELLNIGCNNPKLSSNWKIPFLTGFILVQNVSKKDVSAIKKAENYFEMSARRSSPAPERYVISYLMRAKAAKLGKTWKAKTSKENIQIINDRHALLCAWIEEAMGSPAKADDMSSQSIVQSNTKDIVGKVLSIASGLKEEYPDDPNIVKTINELKASLLKGQNFCAKCMSVYAAGDKFCSCCGAQVVVYGVCGKCGAEQKGSFCSACGAPASAKKQ